MSDAAPPRRIWLCADDYGISPGVNRAIRDLIERGRLNATSVMVVGAAVGRDEVSALKAAAANSPRCAIGLHVTLTAPFRPLTMHFKPIDGGMLLPFPKLLRAGLMRRLDPTVPEIVIGQSELSVVGTALGEGYAKHTAESQRLAESFRAAVPPRHRALARAEQEAGPEHWCPPTL